MKSITTSYFFGWKTVAFLSSQGFVKTEDEDGQTFTSTENVEEIFDGWEPSKDGSTPTRWSELSDKSSAHYGRRYVTAYSYTKGKYENVLLFSSSPHHNGELHSLIGVGSLSDWNRFVVNDSKNFGLTHWMEYNSISLG